MNVSALGHVSGHLGDEGNRIYNHSLTISFINISMYVSIMIINY